MTTDGVWWMHPRKCGCCHSHVFKRRFPGWKHLLTQHLFFKLSRLGERRIHTSLCSLTHSTCSDGMPRLCSFLQRKNVFALFIHTFYRDFVYFFWTEGLREIQFQFCVSCTYWGIDNKIDFDNSNASLYYNNKHCPAFLEIFGMLLSH